MEQKEVLCIGTKILHGKEHFKMPVIGNGDIASVLTEYKDNENIIFFVSGVSNSGEKRDSEFQREIKLLMKQPKDKHLIYISTLSIYYSNSPYVEHKKNMEAIIALNFHSYTIFRIGNITWGTNPNTLINYLKANPLAERRPVWRYLMSKKEFLHWISMAPIPGKTEMNITGALTWVPDLADVIRQQREWKLKAVI